MFMFLYAIVLTRIDLFDYWLTRCLMRGSNENQKLCARPTGHEKLCGGKGSDDYRSPGDPFMLDCHRTKTA